MLSRFYGYDRDVGKRVYSQGTLKVTTVIEGQ